MATFVLWGAVFVLSIVTNTMFDKLKSYGTFAFFAACTFLSLIFFYFLMRETKGLSRDETQVLYAKRGRSSTADKMKYSIAKTNEEETMLK